MSKLSEIKMKMIKDVLSKEDELILAFEKCSINIYNTYKLAGIDDIATLKGVQVQDVIENDEEITIKFNGNSKLTISLDNDSWNGPEALVLNFEDGETIVWN